MIGGIGVDIVDCARMKSFIENQEKGRRFFCEQEYEYALNQGTGAADSLAACFAAKEAFGKALGTGLAGLVLSDIQIVHCENGRPILMTKNSAEKACRNAGITDIHVSLTHDDGMAAAFVVLEKN